MTSYGLGRHTGGADMGHHEKAVNAKNKMVAVGPRGTAPVESTDNPKNRKSAGNTTRGDVVHTSITKYKLPKVKLTDVK